MYDEAEDEQQHADADHQRSCASHAVEGAGLGRGLGLRVGFRVVGVRVGVMFRVRVLGAAVPLTQSKVRAWGAGLGSSSLKPSCKPSFYPSSEPSVNHSFKPKP